MSAIDNAFIRAYTTDTAAIAPRRSAPPRPAVNGHIQPSAIAKTASKTESPQASQRSAAGTPAGRPARPHFVRPAPRPNQDNVVVPAPHLDLASFAQSITTLDAPK